MPGAVVVGQAPNPAIGSAGRPLPQTTVPAGSGPFLRFARNASRPGYARSGDGLTTASITNPLAAAPGYLRWLDLTFVSSGGTSAAAVLSADGPYNLVSMVQFKDPWGTPLLTGPGYELLFLLHKYGGQGFGSMQPGNLIGSGGTPSWVTATSAGNFTFHAMLPVEGTKGYGVISIGNASVMPSLFMSYTSAVFSTQPTATIPTIATTVDEFYYDIDPSNPAVPPGNGSTFQSALVQGSQTVGSASSSRVQLPRTGGYLTSLILEMRDTTGARTEAFSGTGRIRVYIDGVPRYDETFIELQDRMFAMTNGTARDTGTAAYSFKQSLSQVNLGYLDTLEQALQTNPGTLVEVEMTPWATFANSPGTLFAVVTQLVPSGPIAQGLPEV